MVKSVVSIPVIAVGGFRSLDAVEEVLAAGKADYVAMSRPFVREPALIRRWRSGDTRRARCISCTQCYVAAMGGEGIHCVEDRKLQARLNNAA